MDVFALLAIYLCLGMLAGVLAGLLGVGGGLILVPGLMFLFPYQGITEVHIMHIALGTSLATIIVTSIASIRAHHRRQAVNWHILKRITPGIGIGAFLGAMVADTLDTEILQSVFAMFILMISIKMIIGFTPNPEKTVPNGKGLSVTGGLIGLVSSLVGVGGGTLTFPFLVRCNIPVRDSVGTSAACGLPIAIAGSIGYMIMGINEVGLPPYSTGFILWPAFIVIVIASVCFAPLGAMLAHKLPADNLRRVFAVVLAMIALRILLSI